MNPWAAFLFGIAVALVGDTLYAYRDIFRHQIRRRWYREPALPAPEEKTGEG